jgi:hypothetical protein
MKEIYQKLNSKLDSLTHKIRNPKKTRNNQNMNARVINLTQTQFNKEQVAHSPPTDQHSTTNGLRTTTTGTHTHHETAAKPWPYTILVYKNVIT